MTLRPAVRTVTTRIVKRNGKTRGTWRFFPRGDARGPDAGASAPRVPPMDRRNEKMVVIAEFF